MVRRVRVARHALTKETAVVAYGLELTPTFSYYIQLLLLLIRINDEDIESIGAHTQEGVKCVCVTYPSRFASLFDSIIYGVA